MRLDKFLAHAGFGSRSDVKKLIKDGCVTINDIVVKTPDTKIDEQKDIVKVLDDVVSLNRFVYIMMNKKEVNKPSLFFCMGLYVVYTIIEVSGLMKVNKQKTNA